MWGVKFITLLSEIAGVVRNALIGGKNTGLLALIATGIRFAIDLINSVQAGVKCSTLVNNFKNEYIK